MIKSACQFFEITDRFVQNPLIPGCRPKQNQLQPDNVSPPETANHPETVNHKATELSTGNPEIRVNATYTVIRPNYSDKCEAIGAPYEVDCFDHYEFGYSGRVIEIYTCI